MIKVGLDVLGMVDIAMETFAVVFPDQFPVGMDIEIHDLGDFGVRQTLGTCHRRDGLECRFKIRRLLGKTDEYHPFHLASRGAVQAQLGFIQAFLHAPEEDQTDRHGHTSIDDTDR